MAVPVRAELLAQIAALAARQIGSWQRGMEMRRTELLAATRALPAADELLADPRQRLDTLAKRLPRALHANAQLHRTQLTRVAARLSPRLLKLRLARSSEIVVALAKRGKLAQRELSAAARGSPAQPPDNCSRRFPIAACSRAASRWCATARGIRCARPPPSPAACGWISNFPTAASARPPMARARRRQPRAAKPRPRGGEGPGGQGSLFGA